MFGSTILEVAIGMAFIYLVLSLVVTAVNELIASIAKWRSKDLYTGIQELVSDAKDGHNFADRLYAHPLVFALAQGRDKPSYIPSRTFAVAFLDQIASARIDGPRTLAEIRSGIEKLPDHLRTSLLAILDEAGHDVERFKTGLEVWFNTSMERVSGWYKRKSQFVLLILAATISVGFNVDSLLLIDVLSRNGALRQALVAQAEQSVKDNRTPPSQGGNAGEDGAATDRAAEAAKHLRSSVEQLESLKLPIGWTAIRQWDGQGIEPWQGWIRRICGWVLTTLAISFGAPFWFDILNKVINIRGAGKAPEEEPKSPKEVPQPGEPGRAMGEGGSRVAEYEAEQRLAARFVREHTLTSNVGGQAASTSEDSLSLDRSRASESFGDELLAARAMEEEAWPQVRGMSGANLPEERRTAGKVSTADWG